jgi:hypothetical protein
MVKSARLVIVSFSAGLPSLHPLAHCTYFAHSHCATPRPLGTMQWNNFSNSDVVVPED